jgi:hypothetical protein
MYKWGIVGGLGMLIVFGVVERVVPQPMFHLGLFRIRSSARAA